MNSLDTNKYLIILFFIFVFFIMFFGKENFNKVCSGYTTANSCRNNRHDGCVWYPYNNLTRQGPYCA
jgi:hypothetical protein